MGAMGPLVERMPNSVFRQVYGPFLHRGHDNGERAKESIAEQ